MTEAEDALRTLQEKNWVIRNDRPHLWVVGAETPEGLLNVLGMGRTILEAVQMAVRSDAHE